MRKIYFLVFCFLAFGVLTAQEELSKEEQARREKNIQAGNPFAKFGYKAKVATLSKGKYLEVHDLDSIVTIGTIRFHVDRNQIVGNIVIDTTDIYARPIGDMPSRWLSPDPLSEEFPDWSPYTFVFNSPLKYTDPTGMAPEECCDGLIKLLKRGDQIAEKYGKKVMQFGANLLPPIAAANVVSGLTTGEDIYQQKMSGGDMAMETFGIIPFARIGKLGELVSVVTKNGDEVLKVSDGASKAFKEAVEGGRHSKWLETYIGASKKSIEKGANSLDKQIIEHQNLINDPGTYFEKYQKGSWNKLDPRQQDALINKKWPSDIKRLSEQKDILTDLSKQ